MVDADNGRICRLCLAPLGLGDGRAIEEIKKEMLRVLPITINFDISDNAVACDRCLETLQDCFDVAPLINNGDVTVHNKKCFKNEMVNIKSLSMENLQVCRLCMSLIENESFNCATDTDSKDEVHKEFNTAHEHLVCKRWLDNTKKYNEFVNTCQEVELTIKNYCQVKKCATTDRVSLDDILEFKNCNTFSKSIVKKESSDVGIGDAEVMCTENRDIASIKCEGIDIKDELEIGVQTDDFGLLRNCNSSGDSRSSKDATEIRTSASNGNKVHGCKVCSFITNTRLSLQAHMASHRGSIKRYGCPECTYETGIRSNLYRHCMKHKDNSDVKMLTCPSCPFKTKYKRSLMTHQQTHEDPKVVDKFQCGKCPYKTKWKSKLKEHVLSHPMEHMYSCDQCTYSSKVKCNLVSHQLKHRMDGERQMYKCKLCAYQAKTASSVRDHMIRTHTDPSEVSYLKCAHCPYRTAIKKFLIAHIRRQHGNKQQPELECDLCYYVTTEKRYMRQHSFVHREATMRCHQCDFRTKQKRILQGHIKRCHVDSCSSSKQLTFKFGRGELGAQRQGESEPASDEACGADDIPLSNMRQVLKEEAEGE